MDKTSRPTDTAAVPAGRAGERDGHAARQVDLAVDADRASHAADTLATSDAGGIAAALADERAVTAVEYGLIGALIAVAILGAIALAGSSLMALYQYWSSAVVAAL